MLVYSRSEVLQQSTPSSTLISDVSAQAGLCFPLGGLEGTGWLPIYPLITRARGSSRQTAVPSSIQGYLRV